MEIKIIKILKNTNIKAHKMNHNVLQKKLKLKVVVVI